MPKRGRPKTKREKTVSFRLSPFEHEDLRRCALAEKTTMVDFLRDCIQRCKRRHKTAGDWPETREV